MTERDYWGGRRRSIRRVLVRFPSPNRRVLRTSACALKEERRQTVPRSDRSRDVLEALLAAARASGVTILRRRAFTTCRPMVDGFRLSTSRGLNERGVSRPRYRRTVPAQDRQRRRWPRDGASARPHDRADDARARADGARCPGRFTHGSRVWPRSRARIWSRRRGRGADHRPDAVDALRHQRSGGAGHVTPLAPRATRAAPLTVTANSSGEPSNQSTRVGRTGPQGSRDDGSECARRDVARIGRGGAARRFGLDGSLRLADLTRDGRRRPVARADGTAPPGQRQARLQLR